MKRVSRDEGEPSTEGFVDRCIDLCASDKKTLLKKMLREKHAEAARGNTATPGADGDDGADAKAEAELPSDHDELLRLDPSLAEFVDYAYLVCSLESQITKKDLLKITLTKALDTVMTADTQARVKRKKTAQMPPKLSPFILYQGTAAEETLRNMGAIVEQFFPGMECVFPCVYTDERRSEFVLFVPDRQINRWKAAGSQCTFTWRTSEQDSNTDVFSKIINAIPRVHVIRERKRELIYMGTCNQVDDVSSLGTCTMFVS